MFFDGHTDIINDVANKLLKGKGNVFEDIHFLKLKKANVTGGVFNMWVEPQYYSRSYQRLYNLMYIYKNCIASNSSIITVRRVEDLDLCDKFKIVLGVEGMSAVEDDISQIESLYDFGVRHGMLTWNGQNLLAAGAGTSEFSGLTSKGKMAVRIMQELGMIVDVSHLNDKSFFDVLSITKSPVIASHSNSRSLCYHKRNLTDEQLREIAKTGGVVGVNAYGAFVDTDKNCRTIRRFAQHILHVAEVAGINHVGCGFDFCDYLNAEPDPDAVTIGLEDISKVNDLKHELITMGFKTEDIEKIAYKNFHRVIKEILR